MEIHVVKIQTTEESGDVPPALWMGVQVVGSAPSAAESWFACCGWTVVGVSHTVRSQLSLLHRLAVLFLPIPPLLARVFPSVLPSLAFARAWPLHCPL